MSDLNPLTDPSETPEDVATLYSWANLHGAKYRDFSASRAQTREKARLRAEQAMEEAHRASQTEAAAHSTANPEWALEEAKAAEASHQILLPAGEPAAGEDTQASLHAAEQARLAEEDDEAAKAAQIHADELRAEQLRAEEIKAAQVQAERIREEEAKAEQARAEQAKADEQGRLEAEESGRRAAAQLAAQQVAERARLVAEHEAAERTKQEMALEAAREAEELAAKKAAEQAAREAQEQAQVASLAAAKLEQEAQVAEAAQQAEEAARVKAAEEKEAQSRAEQEKAERAKAGQAEQERADQERAEQEKAEQQRPWPKPDRFPVTPAQVAFDSISSSPVQVAPQDVAESKSQDEPQAHRPAAVQHQDQPREESFMSSQTPWATPEAQEANGRPAWLSSEKPEVPRETVQQPAAVAAPDDTLQGSRDRLTSRWFALRGIFDGIAAPVEPTPQPVVSKAPAMAVFSLAGGVGKTSLVATLGRALSAKGERVLLVDTAAFGLLPFFFGATDQRPGVLRTFNPPGLSNDAPVQMVTIDAEGLEGETVNHETLSSEIGKFSRGVSRVIVDLATASGATTRRIMRMSPLVLVPVVADMNSVVSVSSIDAFFEHTSTAAGRPIMPYYLLNQFDASLPLHLDVREVLREQLGDRLLPFAMRRTPAMSEALAEGMTVIDYVPGSPLSEDFSTLAGWVKSLSAPATASYRGVRWSER